MEAKTVQEFFDRLAPNWDAEMIRDDEIIRVILDEAGMREGARVLDVACGTGVLIPDYLARGASSVTAIDLSPEMVKIAQAKFPQENVTILCGDAVEAELGGPFDVIMVYNAFPHFTDPDALIRGLASQLAPGGTLTVAHGMSRRKIDRHHEGTASAVSNGLMMAEDLTAIFARYTRLSAVISNEKMYLVTGRCKS